MDGAPKDEDDVFEQLQGLVSDPITYDLMEDAVISPYGHTYSLKVIRTWLAENNKCPLSQNELRVDQLRPNLVCRDVVKFLKTHSERLQQESRATHGAGQFRDAEHTKARYIGVSIDVEVKAALKQDVLSSLRGYKEQEEMLERRRDNLAASMERERAKVNSEAAEHVKKNETELMREMAELEKRENQLAIEISQSKGEVGEAMAEQKRVQERQSVPILGLLHDRRAEEIQQRLNEVNRRLAAMLNESGRVASRKSVISEELVALQETFSRLQAESAAPMRALHLLQAQERETQREIDGIRKEAAELRRQLEELESSIRESIDEKARLEKRMQQFVEAMQRYLLEAGRIHDELAGMAASAVLAAKHKERGNEHFKKNDFQSAVQCYTQAIVAYCEPAHLLNRAAAYTKLQYYDDAKSDLMRVIEWEGVSNASLGKAYRRLSTVCILQKDKVKAVQWATKALSLDDSDVLAKRLLDTI